MALPYVTLANLKLRLGITDTTDDGTLSRVCDQVNAYVESVTGRAIGSNSVTGQLLDGFDSLEDQLVMLYPAGIRNISSLEVAPTTGDDFVAVASNDVFLMPNEASRQPGWPAFAIQFSDVPTGTYPYFPQGYRNVRISADIGWSEMPEEIREVAEVTAVRAWQARQAGQSDLVGADEIGQPLVSNYLSRRDRDTLSRYRWRSVEVI